MSVFTDFQKAWIQRFPGCELPQAWEEDVRANLSKHRQKVALLREELEKEEFYVEYLERLLADVERVKRLNIVKTEFSTLFEQNGGLKDENKNVSEVKNLITFNSSCAVDQKNANTNHATENTTTDVNATQTDDKIEAQTSSSESNVSNQENKVPTALDSDSYVTVITVGGANTQNKQLANVSSNKPASLQPNESETFPSSLTSVETQFTSSNKKPMANNTLNSPVDNEIQVFNVLPQIKKRPPPLPPPKKAKKTVNMNSPVVNLTDTELMSSFQTANIEPAPKQTFSTFKPQAIEPTQDKKESTLPPINIKPKPTLPAVLTKTLSEDSIKCKPNQNENSQKSVKQEETIPENNISAFDVEKNNRNQDKLLSDLQEYSKDAIYDIVANDEPSDISEPEYSTLPKAKFDRSFSKESLSIYPQPEKSTPESPDSSTYMNIDYFLSQKKEKLSIASLDDNYSQDSDEEDAFTVPSLSSDMDTLESGNKRTLVPQASDEVFEGDSGSSLDSNLFGTTSSQSKMNKDNEESPEKDLKMLDDIKAEAERMTMYKCIISSILESETIYVECLSLLLQYMKALRSTIETSQPLLSMEDFNIIFFKIPELQSIHQSFLIGLKKKAENWDSRTVIGDHFKILASKLGVYAAFLQNYSRAIETVRRCNNGNAKFLDVTKAIKLKSLKGQATNLEDLLHKPVARVQKNALVLHDLIRYTPSSHQDSKTLKTALKMTQCFLNDLNFAAAESMFPAMEKAQRHLVKNSFIVELAEGHRKLRHLFLFNDVIVCAKCKPSNREKFTFEIKWYIPLSDVVLPITEAEYKEVSSQDVLSLKSRANTFRDHIFKEEHQRPKGGARSLDKHKKKLAELEAQLVLASPSLPFRVGQKNKTYTFFLSSEFELMQWTEAIGILQVSAPSTTTPLSPYELQAWITSCRKHLGNSLGSFLLRTGKDEDLLLGELYLSVFSLHGLSRPADVYLCFEVDSYGHFFNKAKTKISKNSTDEAKYNQDFVIEMEGSQTLRILLYETTPNQSTILRGKAALELTGSWLTETQQEKSVALQEFMVTLGLKFVPSSQALARVPSTKHVGMFGVKIQQVCKKEKSTIPFIVNLCVKEVEKRGMTEVGIYRVSGSASDVQKIRKAFESNVYTGEQMIKDVDVHTVTGLLKLYLRELPETLFTDLLYPKLFQAFNTIGDVEGKKAQLLDLFSNLPQVNQQVINFLLGHMVKVNQNEVANKMSLHNLATVFGPNMLGSIANHTGSTDLLTAGTVDVMAQAGILYFFLKRHSTGA